MVEAVENKKFIRFDLAAVARRIRDEMILEFIEKRFGMKAKFVFALLRERPYMTEKQIYGTILLPSEHAKPAMLQMQAAGWLTCTELPKANDYQPNKMIFLWEVPHRSKQRELMRDAIHRSLLRLAQRQRHEEKEHHVDEV